MILRVFIALFVVLMIALAAAANYLPWWGFLLVLVAIALAVVLVLRYFSQQLTTQLFSIPFRAKGAVLKGASVEIHEVKAVPAPSADEHRDRTLDESLGPIDYYSVDATITPGKTPGPFHFWEPGDLSVIQAKAKMSSFDNMPESSNRIDLQVFDGEEFRPDEGMKYPGPQRVKLIIGVPLNWPRELAFQYYFSKFGKFTLPVPLRNGS